MKNFFCVLMVLAFAGSTIAAEKSAKQSQNKTAHPQQVKKNLYSKFKDELSYAIGTQIGTQFKNQDMDINLDILKKAIKDALESKTLMSEEELRMTMMQFQKEMQEKMVEMREKGKKEGEAFLAKNKLEKDVIVLPDGLQYKILVEGKGEKPQKTDSVNVHYAGTLIDGTEFDSSYKRGEPMTFPVQGVIPGWTEILQLMPVGSKWQVFIPSQLAYGERGGPGIPPNSTLIFVIELLDIEQTPAGK